MKSEWGIGIGSKAERAAQTMIENGSVTSAKNAVVADPVTFLEKGLEWVIGGIKVLATFLVKNNEIFVIICMIGMVIVIIGHEELGKKLTGGGIIGFIISKVVSEWP